VETICDVSIAMDASPEYGLNPREAAAVLKEVQAAVRDWRGKATQLNVPKAEQDLMADAFQV
jgi:serine/threonine-protein kinase HipA